MNSSLTKEQLDLIELFKLLEETFKGNNSKKIEEAIAKIQDKFTDKNYGISLLFQALSINKIENKEITIDNHKSVAIYLKNIFSKIYKILTKEEIFSYLEKIFELLFVQSKINENLNKPLIFNLLQNIVTTLLSSPELIQNTAFINQLFNILLNSIKSEKKELFLITSKKVVLLCTTLLTTRCANNNNFEELINKYYMPIVNIIFNNVSNYIDPKSNYYNEEFISILKCLFDGFYSNLSKMRGIFDIDKRKEIALLFFKEYGLYSYELIQLTPSFDENTAQKFGNPNPIIVLNVDENKCSEINHMKSKALQFLSFITQVSTLEKKTDEENRNFIDDQELVGLINKIIYLIINTFKDVLNNKEKFLFLRKYRDNEEEDCFNLLLFQICVFLTRSLIREPIKSQFSEHIKQFLLNILFPMNVTILEDEKDFLDMEPEEYHSYINDITSDFKNKNFRTSGSFLIYKICEKYEDITNFVLSFNIEMIKYIINEGKIKSQVSEYNIYLKYLKDALINQFNDETKLDFAFLIILIFQSKIKSIDYFNTSLRNILINNQDKIHLIKNPIIRIKLCKLYTYFLPNLFENSNDIQDENIKKKFIENTINFLLNNIIQNNAPNNYCQSLSNAASEAITELLTSSKGHNDKENQILMFYISQNLENNFHIFNQLIENIDVYSFFLVIEQTISSIIIKERNLLFQCLNNLTKKFIKQFVQQKMENNKLFNNQYFSILNSFLTGKNKINSENKEEIKKFNEIFDLIVNYIKNPKKFPLYDELVSLTETYIKAFNGINERSSLVLKNLKLIIDEEKSISPIAFNFASTFLLYIQKNISDQPLDQSELFKEILQIIQKSFSFTDETYESSKISALLLTLQILNLNPNLPEEILKFLFLQSLSCFEGVNKHQNFPYIGNNINQLVIANISLGFIFKPDLTFKILQEKKIKISEKNEITCFVQFFNLIYYIIELRYPDYNPLLGKCIILGMCGILTDKTCLDFLNNNKKNKLFLLNIFTNFVLKHKREKCTILNKLMKKELKCNFVEDENEEEEEEEEDDEIDYDFNEDVENILSGDNNINNSDEFKFFSQVMKYIRENDQEIYNRLITECLSGHSNFIEELFKIRNIKIKYNNKEFTVPRKTVKIVKK